MFLGRICFVFHIAVLSSLSYCNVMVSSAKHNQFQQIQGQRLTHASTHVTADSNIQCTAHCSEAVTCFAASYSTTEKRCELSDLWIGYSTTEDAVGWDVYYNTDDCLSSPCLNGGTCTDEDGSFTCTCLFPWKFADCSWHDCLINPCQNGGLCSNTIDSYTCECIFPWTGTDCDIQRSWQCYDWSASDRNWMNSGASETTVCESEDNGIYTMGNEDLAPGCGGCWCCREVT